MHGSGKDVPRAAAGPSQPAATSMEAVSTGPGHWAYGRCWRRRFHRDQVETIELVAPPILPDVPQFEVARQVREYVERVYGSPEIAAHQSAPGWYARGPIWNGYCPPPLNRLCDCRQCKSEWARREAEFGQ